MDVTNIIGDKTNGSIHIDESGFRKDEKDSVGLKRQYLGRLGKIENCQMGVFLDYANGNRKNAPVLALLTNHSAEPEYLLPLGGGL
jgi:SRSO17 transposase